jgi:hypothetical protein
MQRYQSLLDLGNIYSVNLIIELIGYIPHGLDISNSQCINCSRANMYYANNAGGYPLNNSIINNDLDSVIATRILLFYSS